MRQLGFIVFMLMILSSSQGMARDHIVFTPLPMQGTIQVDDQDYDNIRQLKAATHVHKTP